MRRVLHHSLFLFLASTALFQCPAFADGMLFKGRDRLALSPLRPGEQVAAIIHRDHRQKMVIALRFQLEEQDKALWMFPVPGTPDTTRLELVDSFPRFGGRDIRSDAAFDCYLLMALVRATQFWPVLFEGEAVRFFLKSGVAVHSEVNKWGIHAETITANSMEDLAAHLREKKAGIPAEHLRSFQPYLSGQHVLVVAWISSEQELLEAFPEYEKQRVPGAVRQPAVYIEFPTERAYYPLRATSAYGDETVGVRLFLAGYMLPDAMPRLAGSLQTALYDQESAVQNAPKVFSEALPSGPFHYTAVSISSAASNFTNDLWFSPAKVPASYGVARAILKVRPTLFFLAAALLLLIAALSYVAAGLAGLWRGAPWRTYAYLGFWNLLTVAAMWIAIRFSGERGEEARKKKFLRAFTCIFVLLTVLLDWMFWLLLGAPQGIAGNGVLMWTFIIPLLIALCLGVVFLVKTVSRLLRHSFMKRA